MTNNLLTVYSGNVVYTGQTFNDSCIQICQYTDTVSDVIEKLVDVFCSNINNGKIKVTSQDQCADFLSTKLTSNDSSVGMSINTDANGCKSIDFTVPSLPSLTAVILYNNNSVVTRTSANDFQSYTSPANTLGANGDQLIIDNYINGTMNLGVSSVFSIYFGTSQLFTSSPIGNSNGATRTTVTINRINATTINVETEVKYYDNNNNILNTHIYPMTNVTVDCTISNVIKSRLVSTTGTLSVNSQYLTVKKYKA